MRVGIDIGGTKMEAVVIDAAGAVTHSVRVTSPQGDEAVLAAAEDAVRQVAAAASLAVSEITSVGVGIPGAVDADAGRVMHAVNLEVDDLALGPRLAERLGRPVRVENDVNAAALGVAHLLSLRDAPSIAYLNVGTGLAAGLVVGGRIWRGRRGVAGEVGHLPVDPNGELCPCGQRGCIEMYASGSAIARLWPTDDPMPVRSLFAAADAGDPRAQALREGLFRGVAEAVRLLVLTVDVDHVVLGGGVSRMGAPFLEGVREVITLWESGSAFVASLGLPERLQLLPADFPAAAAGAALVGELSTPSTEVL